MAESRHSGAAPMATELSLGIPNGEKSGDGRKRCRAGWDARSHDSRCRDLACLSAGTWAWRRRRRASAGMQSKKSLWRVLILGGGICKLTCGLWRWSIGLCGMQGRSCPKCRARAAQWGSLAMFLLTGMNEPLRQLPCVSIFDRYKSRKGDDIGATRKTGGRMAVGERSQCREWGRIRIRSI
ncbi:uncharacterized protein BKA78DRAFT_318301 [Phyllosticta capitalensis]|uniref:uncharacterized protein n=1 Tax=Phyllosticta capitalensis TaxID=121624 RepID=UPI00312CC89F